MKVKVGDYRWYVEGRYVGGKRVPHVKKCEVVRVGRKYVYLKNISEITNQHYDYEHKANADATRFVGDYYHKAVGKLYRSPEEYETEIRRNEMWSTVRDIASRQHITPDHVSTDDLQNILKILKGK